MRPLFGRAWVADDGRAGHRRQAVALAERLASQVDVLPFSLIGPWRQFAPRLRVSARRALRGPLADKLADDPPDLLVAAGRRGALASIAVKRASGGRTRTVQILDPRIATAHFDLVIAPSHDQLAGPNVITTTGSLHPVDDRWLDAARSAWSQNHEEPPRPLVALLVGGPTRHLAVNSCYLQRMIDAGQRAISGGGALWVVASSRTPAAQNDWLRGRIDPDWIWTGPPDGPNPYGAALALADHFIVSGDSVNMISEALATGRPVYSEGTPASGRVGEFHRRLLAEGRLRNLDQAPAPAGDIAPLRETGRVADLILARWTP